MIRIGRRAAWAAAATLAAVLAAGSARPADDPPKDAPATTPDPVLAEVVRLHNRERAGRDLPPLEPNPKLREAAERHARDMAESEKMGHEGSDGSTPPQRVQAAGYKGAGSGENVAAGQETAEEVVRAWMDSPPHRENILGDFGEIGAATSVGTDGKIYWAVEFGRPWPKLDPAEASADLAGRINAARSEAEKPELRRDRYLAAAAAKHARTLAAADSLPGEADPDAKPKPAEFPRVEGPRRRKLSLSVTSGPTSPEEAMEAILEQPEQKANILGDHRSFGVGYARTEEGRPYWVILLGTP